MEKVFCGECIYFQTWGGLPFCEHPDNNRVKYNWREKWNANIRKPEIINKKNNCKWYKNRPNGWSKSPHC